MAYSIAYNMGCNMTDDTTCVLCVRVSVHAFVPAPSVYACFAPCVPGYVRACMPVCVHVRVHACACTRVCMRARACICASGCAGGVAPYIGTMMALRP